MCFNLKDRSSQVLERGYRHMQDSKIPFDLLIIKRFAKSKYSKHFSNWLSLANLEGHFMTIKAQLWSERLKQILIQEIWWWEYFETMGGNLRNWDDIR